MTSSDTRRRGPYAKSAQRRASIVAAAFEVFAARGYQSGSFQDVADRVGMSQTSLLHYFPRKADLLVAVLDHRDALADSGPVKEGEDFPQLLVDQARHNETTPSIIELYTILCGESVTDDHPARGYFTGRFQRLRFLYARELVRLREAGRLVEGVDPDRAAASILALWDGIQTQWLLDSSVDAPACLADYLNLIIRPAGGRRPTT